VKSLAELKDEMSEETTGVAKNNGGAELSEAEKLEYAESLKAEQAEKFKQRKAAKAEFALADAEAKVTYLYSRETGCFEPTRNTAAGAKAEGVVAELAQSVGVKLGAPKAEAKAEFAGATIKPKIEAPPRVEPAAFDEKDLTRVPGVVGRLTDWSEAASLYPNRRLALGASLVTFATVIGQRVAGPTHGSTHVYVALLAPTAAGKRQPIDNGKETLRAVGAADRIGSGDFRSSVALVNALRAQSVFCSFIDEYGLVLQRVCHKGAGAYEQDLIGVAQSLWGLNWTFFNSPASARQKQKQIFAPQFSICGVSIPQQFYRAVSSKEISGGFLNRHLILRGDDRPELRKRAQDSWKLPDKLRDELSEMYRPRSGLKPILDEDQNDDRENIDDEPFDPEIEMVWGIGAEQVWLDLVGELKKETDDVRRDLFARVGEMVIRFATIVAFGRHSLTVDRADMEWARALVMESAESLHRDVLKYTVDMQDFPGLCQRIMELATPHRWISARDLKRGCQNYLKKGGDLDGAIKHLVEAERLVWEVRGGGPKGGRSSPGYALCD
jgi:hypothetical protein